jgi:hypothetical protein
MVVIVTPAPNPVVSRELTRHFLLPAILGGNPSGRRKATSKIAPGNFLWPTIPGGKPSGPSAEQTSKIAPGDFLF